MKNLRGLFVVKSQGAATSRFSYLTFFGLFSASFFIKYLRYFKKKKSLPVAVKSERFLVKSQGALSRFSHLTNFLSFNFSAASL